MSAQVGRLHIVCLGMLVVWLSGPVLAQRTAEDTPGRGGALMARVRSNLADLRLTESQQKQVDEILEHAGREFREMGPGLLEAAPAERRAKVEQFLKGVHDKLTPVLNEEQRATFEQRMKQMQAGRRPAASDADPAGFGPQQDRPGPMIDRVRQALEGLGLSDEQQTQIDQILADARQQVQKVRRESEGNPQAIREKVPTILNEAREKLADVLTPEQREKFGDEMSAAAAPEARKPEPPPMMQDPKLAAPAMSDDPMKAAAPPAAPAAAGGPVFDDESAAAVGQPAPALGLKKIDGTSLSLESLRGRIVLVVFGSYSSPAFRDRSAALERIKRDYGNRVSPIVVYTREMHPSGEWEVGRNKDEGVAIEQPADMEARVAAAKRARDSLKLSVPIAVDGMDDPVAKAYGAQTGAAFLIGRDGTVLARQRWFEPYAMRRALEEALKAPATQPK